MVLYDALRQFDITYIDYELLALQGSPNLDMGLLDSHS